MTIKNGNNLNISVKKVQMTVQIKKNNSSCFSGGIAPYFITGIG